MDTARQIDRQTDGWCQVNRLISGSKYGWVARQMNGQVARHIYGWCLLDKLMWIDEQIQMEGWMGVYIQMDSQTGRYMDRKMERWRDKQTNQLVMDR